MSRHTFVHMPIHTSIDMPMHICMSTHVPHAWPKCMSYTHFSTFARIHVVLAHLFVCLCTYLYTCRACVSIHMSMHMSMHTHTHRPQTFPCVHVRTHTDTHARLYAGTPTDASAHAHARHASTNYRMTVCTCIACVHPAYLCTPPLCACPLRTCAGMGGVLGLILA